ncbi:MAG TPA: ATP-dependent helicase [Candidatus Saccharimonadales bacterium]|nr:ATP-dependent helicase [Candidatus Saccharimonadales bacterium]
MGIFDELNEQQRSAVETTEGPIQIIAGPGSGKTKTLTARLAYLCESKSIPSDKILALTFSSKAAQEIKRRLGQKLTDASSLPAVYTFHAFGHRLLSEARQSRPIIGEIDRRGLIAQLPRPKGLQRASSRELNLLLSNAKTALRHAIPAATRSLLDSYEQALQSRGVCDFDDLLVGAYRLLETGQLKPAYRYVLVDEFQDTSELQYELLRLLTATDNICVIGDPKQSIYGFRGAHSGLFERFRQDYPKAQTITLHCNYRSARRIVTIANRIFPGTKQRSMQNDMGVACGLQTLNEYSEAAYIIREIQSGIGGSDMLSGSEASAFPDPSSYAVLYRTHRAARVLRQRFASSGIPYQVAGEQSPYEQPAIQAVLSILQAVVSSEMPPQALTAVPALRGVSRKKLQSFLMQLQQDAKLQSVSSLIEHIADLYHLHDVISQTDLQQLAGVAVQFGEGLAGVQAFLQHVEHIAEQDFYDPTLNVVSLLTIHSAKGLEFPVVFLCAAEEGILPKAYAKDIEEERRLFYVAITRAQHRLDICMCQWRGKQASTPSRFVAELPEDVLPRRIDSQMVALEKRLKRHQQKRAQASLF